jgi:ABC-type phosphate/phosphonate transport system ATPase subunit
VQVNSDGKTYIVVLGVGHVGEYKQKVISLKPGKYVLQGKREGYRNKRVEFTVKANTPISVSLVCDERI